MKMTLHAVKRLVTWPSVIVAMSCLMIFVACQKESEFQETQSITIETFTTEILPNLSGDFKNFFTSDYASSSDARLQVIANGRSPDPLIAAAKLNLYLQDAELSNTLVSSLIETVGYPIWDHAIIDYTTENAISIPFTKLDATSTTAGVLMGYGTSDLSQFHFLLIDKANINEQMQLHTVADQVWNLSGSVYAIYKHEVEVFEYVDSNYVAWMNGLAEGEEGVDSAGDRNQIISVCVECPPDIAYVTNRPVYTMSTEREICCAVVQLPCNSDQGGSIFGSCIPCGSINITPPGSGGNSTSGGSSSNNDDHNDGPNPLEDGGTNGNQGDSEQEEEECRSNAVDFIDDMRLTLLEMKTLGVDLESCCEEADPDYCRWNEIKNKYGFDFTRTQYETKVVPFLDEYEWKIEEIWLNGVDIAECLQSGEFGNCAWSQYIYNVMPEDDFNQDEIDFTAENRPIGGKAKLKTKDWTTLSDNEKLNHVMREMRRMVYSHKCFLNAEENYYTLVEEGGIFSNVVGSGVSWYSKGDVDIAANNQPADIVPNVGWGWSRGSLTGQAAVEYETFGSNMQTGYSSSFMVQHYFWSRKGSSDPSNHINAVLDFTVPDVSISKMHKWLNVGCP